MAWVLVLIHGTFAKGTKWPLVDQVGKEQLKAPIEVKYFEWTGNNDVSDRTEAAIRLRDDLAAWFDRFANARFYVVAHSHGGNIAVRALSAGANMERVRALICLSTPFLDAQLRWPEPSTGAMLLLSSIFWVCAVLFLSYSAGLGVGVAFLTILILAVLYLRRARKAGRRVEALLDQIALPKPIFSRLFVLRSPHDEAAIGLTLAQLVHVVLSLWRRFEALFGLDDSESAGTGGAKPDRAFTPAMRATYLLAAVVWVVVSWQHRHVVPDDWLRGWRLLVTGYVYVCLSAGTVGVLGGLIAFCFFIVIGMPTLLLNSILLAYVFGVADFIAATLWLEVAVEPIPPGMFKCCQLPWPATSLSGVLYHSLTYQDPSAIKQVGEWLREAQGEPDSS